jgi:hypothetical protein
MRRSFEAHSNTWGSRMSISELRDSVQGILSAFLWDEWGQMGVSAVSRGHDVRAADPEALLLLTFEVGRGEPRLLDEVLGWLLLNERLISVQRLRNLAEDDDDRALVEAVLGWLGQNRRRPRLGAKQQALWADKEPEPFFRDSRLEVSNPDLAFMAQGFLKPRVEASEKSQAPDLQLPINFAFRLRLLFGVSVRAEVIRLLLTIPPGPRVNARVGAQVLAMSSAYTKRNVQEAVGSLVAAGMATAWTLGNENRFELAREDWQPFLHLREFPRHAEWPQLFRVFRLIMRWLVDPAHQDVSEYMLTSKAHTLVEDIAADLRFAGVALNPGDWTRDLPSFERFLHDLLGNSLSVEV